MHLGPKNCINLSQHPKFIIVVQVDCKTDQTNALEETIGNADVTKPHKHINYINTCS